jgi:hypothetical protein
MQATDRVLLHPADISRVCDDLQRKSQPFHVWYSAGKDELGIADTVGEDEPE